MPRLSPIACLLLITACQANVQVTDSDPNNDSDNNSNPESDGSAADETGVCAAGDDGCPCYANLTCNGELVCVENFCQQPPADETGSSTGKPNDESTGTTQSTAGETVADTSGDTGDTSGDTSSESSGKTTQDTTTSGSSDTSSTGSDDSTSSTGSSTGDTGSSTGDTGSSTGDDTDGNASCGNVPSDMVCVPADTFEMGTSLNIFLGQNIAANEKPGHMVTLTKSYWIDKNEVTVEDYALCWANQVCTLPLMGPGYNWGVMNKEKYPINGVDWYQAKKYCEWKSKRLPTEAEWELAARGTDGRLFPWGDDKPTCMHVVSDSCGTSGTQKVGSKPMGASPYGALDMAGNICEWTSDYYKEDYYYESPAVDPKGPMTGTNRVARSFNPPMYDINTAANGRATLRGGFSPLLQNVNPVVVGFRCAKTAL